MRICWSCGNEEYDDERFCTNCGADLNDDEDREYKKTILEPNKIVDEKTGLDKYVLTWCQISEIIEIEIEERKRKLMENQQ